MTVVESKIAQTAGVYALVGVVEESDGHYVIDLFPGGPGPLLRVDKQYATVEATSAVIADAAGEEQTISQIFIERNAPVVTMHADRLSAHPLEFMGQDTMEDNALLMTGAADPGAEGFGWPSWKDVECTIWKSNPLYWQLVAALKVAKSTGVIEDEAACKQLAALGTQLGVKLGLPSSLTKLISGSMSKCACSEVF